MKIILWLEVHLGHCAAVHLGYMQGIDLSPPVITNL